MMDSSATWNGHDPTLSMGSQDDFQQYLDMSIPGLGDNLQFDFSDFNQQGQAQSQAQGQAQAQAQRAQHAMDGQDTTMQENMASMTTAVNHLSQTSISGHSSNDSLLELDQQIQYLQQQRLQHQQRQMQDQQRNYYAQGRMVPPTPGSMEMHPATSHFYPQSDPQQQAFYERRLRMQKEQEVSKSSVHKVYHANIQRRWPLPLWFRRL
jgi:hypothetical protein